MAHLFIEGDGCCCCPLYGRPSLDYLNGSHYKKFIISCRNQQHFWPFLTNDDDDATMDGCIELKFVLSFALCGLGYVDLIRLVWGLDRFTGDHNNRMVKVVVVRVGIATEASD